MFSRCINTMARSSALPVLMLPKVIACNPDKDIFDIGREAIGCDWIELVEAEPLAKDGLLMMIDEEGKLKPGGALINATASALYAGNAYFPFPQRYYGQTIFKRNNLSDFG